MSAAYKATVLVVDDDPHLLNLLVDTLSTLGYQATAAQDGVEALDILKQQTFDLMISDVKMPRLDGLGLLGRVRRYYPNLPVLLITGLVSPEILEDASPDGYLAKPFRIQHIERLIEDTLERHPRAFEGPVKRVLIVDKDSDFRRNLVGVLRNHGYEAYEAMDCDSATRTLEHNEIDVIITDIAMPRQEGVALMKEVKSRYPSIPVVLVSATNEDASELQQESSEVDGYLQKPFRADTIINLLNGIFQLSTVEN